MHAGQAAPTPAPNPPRIPSLATAIGPLLAIACLTGVLLSLPVSLAPGRTLVWSDALFTSVSAVTLTGQSVVDPATQFTPIGQGVLAISVQLSALVVLTWTGLAFSRLFEPRRDTSAGRIISTVLLIEMLGALAMFPFWTGPMTVAHRLGLSLFFAVGSFCNTGFSLFPGSLASAHQPVVIQLLIAPLIVLGGLGAPVLSDIAHRRHRPMTGMTRTILVATAGVYLLGVVLLMAASLMPYCNATLFHLTEGRTPPPPLNAERFAAMLGEASFTSISARSAGYLVNPAQQLSPATQVTLWILMFIGGGPAGAAGGVRMLIPAVMVGLIASGRLSTGTSQLPSLAPLGDGPLLRWAMTVLGGQLALLAGCVFLLAMVEPYPLSVLLFDAVGCVSNSGLTVRSGDPSYLAKIILWAGMLAGRLWPMICLARLDVSGPGTKNP